MWLRRKTPTSGRVIAPGEREKQEGQKGWVRNKWNKQYKITQFKKTHSEKNTELK